ncbi:MAG: DUF1887 family CARF protein [Campylobacterota bacterium]|nr:DUF1887 family CARF protein [Campylobacterota bacterium]
MTLLSIVGEDISRIIPVLYAYKNKIKQHVLLCDDDPSNHERAKTLQRGMQKFSAKHSLGWYTKVIITDEDSAADIKEVAQKQFSHENELWLNATDGYPAITILLSEMVRKEGGKVLSYDHFDNDLHIIEPDGTMKCKQLKSCIDVENYLLMLNYKIKKISKRKQLVTRKKSVIKLFKKERDFKKVRKSVVQEYLGHNTKLKKNHFPEIFSELKKLGILKSDGTIKKSQIKTIQGDLLEEYIFWLTDEVGFDDMALGVQIDFDNASKEPQPQRRVVNEFDILMTHKNRLYTIECKFKNEMDGLGMIYKYETIINYFGRAAKAMVLNISKGDKEPYLDTKTSPNFAHSALRRARMSGIGIYHESSVDTIKLQNYIRNFFRLN